MEYIIDFEYFVPNEIDTELLLNIENKIRNHCDLTEEETKLFLDSLSYLIRYKINPNLTDYTFKCDLAQSILYYYLKDLGCNVILNSTQSAITNNIEGHNFLILELNVDGKETLFLLDPTYSQFFKKEECIKENYLIINGMIIITPKPGFFIKKQDYEYAKYLLQYGNIILSEEVAMMYGDSFYNTKVGGYYSKNNTNTINSMPGSVYINAFTKNNCKVSKTREELKNMGVIVESISQLEENLQPKL